MIIEPNVGVSRKKRRSPFFTVGHKLNNCRKGLGTTRKPVSGDPVETFQPKLCHHLVIIRSIKEKCGK